MYLLNIIFYLTPALDHTFGLTNIVTLLLLQAPRYKQTLEQSHYLN